MTLHLDSGGVSHLARDRALLTALRAAGRTPPLVCSAVLVECLTGDPRRDHATNRLLRACSVVPADELLAREAARLRTATGRASGISAVDALVVALAARHPGSVVMTTDPRDLDDLAAQSVRPPTIRTP